MRGKKLLAFILAAGMAGSALAGCMPGTGATGSEPAAETKQESASGTENVISEEASVSEETQGGYSLPLCEPGSETLSILTYQNWHASAYYDSDDGLPVENEIEKITGVKVNWECVASGDYNTVAQTRLASGSELPDIIRVPNGTTGLADYSSQGLLVNIKEYINET